MTIEQIVIRIKEKDEAEANMELLYGRVKAFLHTMALRYQGQAELEDLEQEGYLALYPAIDGYNPDKGVKFLTYAEYYIQLRMQRYIWKNGNGVRMPFHCREKLGKYKRFCNEFLLQHHREPSDWEAARHMELSTEQIRALKKGEALARVGSLDRYLGDEDTTLGEMIPSMEDLEGDAVERLNQETLKSVIWPIVDTLPGKQGQVIRMRYQEQMTLKETGKCIGVNTEAARQWERKALEELRRPSRARRLRPFLPEEAESMAYRGGGAAQFNRTWTSSTERAALHLTKQGCAGNSGF